MTDPRLIHRHAQSSAGLEDRIAIQHREIQALLVDNQRLAATHVALKQELAATQQELVALSAAAKAAKAERDAQVREVYERSLKADSEARLIDAMTAELDQVREDVKKLAASRKELAAELREVEEDAAKAREEAKNVPEIKAEIGNLRSEIQRGRAAIEQEKKTRIHNLEHREAMEKSMVSMSHQIEKLQAELTNAESRARAAAAANPNHSYAAIPGNTDMGYGGQSFSDSYNIHCQTNMYR